jgi:hypothetical protein
MSRTITEVQREWLAGEVDAWLGMGMLTDDQAQALLALYPTREEAGRLRQSRALFTLLALSAVLIGLGVFLLVAYNWDEMHAAVKVVLIVAGLAACHGSGLALRYRAGLPTASEVAFFLGCLFYGAGIWLIAQIFHVSTHYPDGYWWWALGVLPFALALDTLVMHALLVALLAAWAGTEVLGFSDMGAWLFFGRPSFLPNGAYGLLLMAAPGVFWAYRKGSAKALGLYVPLLAWWVILQPFAWRMQGNPVFFIGAVGGLLLLASEMHPGTSLMAVPYRFYGGLLSAGVLVPLSYFEFNKAFGHQTFGSPSAAIAGLEQLVAILVVSALTLGLVLAVRHGALGRAGEARDGRIPAELAELARRQWVPCSLIAVMAVLAAWKVLVAEPLLPSLLANAAMVGLALWLMQVGLRTDRGLAFGSGVAYFLFWAVLRYIDLFGDLGGMLGGALMFFLCGATLFGVALYWRRRKGVSLV